MTPPFAQPLNSLDPPSIDRVKTFRDLVRERYLISKNINTSYNEVGKLSVLERKYIVDFLIEEAEQTKEKLKQAKQKQLQNTNSNRRR